MDFFSQQDRARRNTRYLLFLFAFTVLVLIVLLHLLATAFLWFVRDYNIYGGGSGLQGYLALLSWERFAYVSVAVISTVGLVSMVRWLQLSSGGKTVAESMGGRRILPQTRDRYEKRCLNIVEELSLAANMPVPSLYVMPEERGINAFAAGITTADAVVAVTRGTLLQLNREELQGVIGHEFSHILNGDMRLGIRLAALLKGITFLGDVGHFILRAGVYGVGPRSERGERSAALPVVGLGLLVVGWLGSLAAGFIKAAISRQKEYLADASAVQFTRDKDGIANALKVIGGFLPGSMVHAARAAELSHIFFGEVQHHLWDGFATHPPLEQRIRRLERNWDGEFISRPEVRYGVQPLDAAATATGVGRAALVSAALASTALDGFADAAFDPRAPDEPAAGSADPTKGLETLHELVLEPLGAGAVALGLIAANTPGGRDAALELIRAQAARGQAELVADIYPQLAALSPGERFPLLASAMPALKGMSTPQYRQFKSALLAVIRLDQRTDLFEWCLFQLLRHYLDPEYLQVEKTRPKYSKLTQVRAQLNVVLSVLAYQGTGDTTAAYEAGCEALQLRPGALLQLEDCDIAAFSRAVHSLGDCYPLLKPRILKAMAVAAASDGEVCAIERELITAIAAVMDCPLPPELALEPGH